MDAFVDGQGDYALTAYSDNSVGTGVALWGYCPSPNGWAVYHNGRFGGVGLAVNQLDHPLDPTNKTINNYSVESTEPTYSYRGNAVLDANGEAVGHSSRLRRIHHERLPVSVDTGWSIRAQSVHSTGSQRQQIQDQPAARAD